MQKMNGEGKLAIAVQRPKNRDFDRVKTLLEDCKISFEPKSEGLVPTSNPNFNVVLLPPKDIPRYIAQGVALGICGQDMVAESNVDVLELCKLGFGKVRVSFAAPAGNRLNEITDWDNMRIGTALPNLAAKFAESNDGNTAMDAALRLARIIPLDGALENAIALRVVDAIVDQVVTGNSLKKAGLVEVKRIMDSEFCLIANKRAYARQKAMIKPLKTMLESIVAGKNLNFVVFNGPTYDAAGNGQAISRGEIPCGESPTKTQLIEKGAFAYSIIVKDDALMETLGKLETLGVRDIVVSEVKGYTKGQVVPGKQLTVEELYSTLLDRQANPKKGSATNRLLSSRNALGEKIVEEAGELYEAAFNDQGKFRVASEASDVLYAFLVGCAASGFKKETVLEIFGRAQMGELNEFRRFDLQGGAARIKEELRMGNMSTGTALVFLSNVNETLVQQGITLEEVVR